MHISNNSVSRPVYILDVSISHGRTYNIVYTADVIGDHLIVLGLSLRHDDVRFAVMITRGMCCPPRVC